MKTTLSLNFLAPLLAAAVLAGCGPAVWDQGRPHRYPDRDPEGAYGRYGDRVVDVQGTVASVNPRDRLIYVNREDRERTDGRYDPRNGDGRSGPGDTVAISYDDDTVVSYQGRTFRPGDLERGDRVQASIERDGDYLLAQRIDVLYDVSGGGPAYPGDRGGYGDRNGGYDRGPGNDNDGGYAAADLQGIVRAVDTRNHTLEIDRSQGDGRGNRFNSDSGGYGGASGTVLVRYDAGTTVRFQGRDDYSPENLERGDVVRIQARDDNGRLTAERIDVLGENGRSSGY